ncbi:hypothetical protein [Ruegeria arenilitoris]|uniref:hypothetical protein n=1 Tax=Ruegeria arenilitoris TaxID=1173585 RepID=UPI0014799367|nr:hypothetical protein [Ruegeria arenilitoris]
MSASGTVSVLTPATAFAHDAFGDLGPFYGSMLHPLADPLQAAILIGTAAFLAGRSLTVVRSALPVFLLATTLANVALSAGQLVSPPTWLAGLAAVLAGLAATLPERLSPRPAVYALVAVTGALTGLASGASDTGPAIQPLLGSIFGISILAMLAWFAMEAASRRLTRLVPKVVGSWVAAVGILVVAFSV